TSTRLRAEDSPAGGAAGVVPAAPNRDRDAEEIQSMSYLLRRLEFFLVTLWAALTLNFILPRLMPGNPAEAMLVRFHGRASPQAVKTLEVAFGLHTDQNIFQQYLQYLGNTLAGNFGTSVSFFPSSVGQVIMLALPWTIG